MRKTHSENIDLEVRLSQFRGDINSRDAEIVRITLESSKQQQQINELQDRNATISTINNERLQRIDELNKELIIKDAELNFQRVQAVHQEKLINPINPDDYKSPYEFKMAASRSIALIYDRLLDKRYIKFFLQPDVMPGLAFPVPTVTQRAAMEELGLIESASDVFQKDWRLTWTGEKLMEFIKILHDLKSKYVESNFTDSQRQDFIELPIKRYNDQFLTLREFGNCRYQPSDFNFKNEFQEYLFENFYLSNNRGFIEFTNKGLKMINYLQNVYY